MVLVPFPLLPGKRSRRPPYEPAWEASGRTTSYAGRTDGDRRMISVMCGSTERTKFVVGARLGATWTNGLPIVWTYMNNGQRRDRGHGLI
jgi:hypothetical protein